MNMVGLTGGIATGKSTVSRFFAEAGACVVDADRIAHGVVAKGGPEWRKIVDCFGETVLLPDGEIDRARLGNIVFNDPDARSNLNRIVHPAVFEEMNRIAKKADQQFPDRLIILDTPLLIESGAYRNSPLVVLVYAPMEIQLQRLMARDGTSAEDAAARIRSQTPIDEKKQYADVIIDNSGPVEQTRIETLNVFEKLKTGAFRCRRR